MQVLFRLTNPSSGTVYIDGQDYLQCGLHDLRSQLSVIPQTPFIFRATVRQNLDPFNLYTDDEVILALERVHLLPLIQSLPDSIHTPIESTELNLSAGQKQLICLGRALIRRNKIVMMDEATANIDHHTDELIQESMRKYFSDCTLLIVAHRLRTIVLAPGIHPPSSSCIDSSDKLLFMFI